MTTDAHPSHPRSAQSAQARRHGASLYRTRSARGEPNLAHPEWLALLLDREAATRNTKRFQTRLRAARLRHSQAAVEDVDYRSPRRLDKALFQQLATSRWIAERRSLLVTGPCGLVT
jgi:DNA replication protein DnaC